MSDDLHKLYKEKEKQYQDYLVEKRVYEQNLAAAKSNLIKSLDAIRETLPHVNSPLSERILAIVNSHKGITESCNLDDTYELMQQLESVSKDLEAEIREALS